MRKQISDEQRRYAQYYNALHYNGAIPIFDKIVKKFNDGFWMEFSLKPTKLSRTYKIVLIYINGYMPYSYVISPNLVKISHDRTVPHLYNQETQSLCLTHPSLCEWNKNKLIVDTYIPWIAHWLYYYEVWLLSDQWEGGGIHPGDEIDTELKKLAKKQESKKQKKVSKDKVQSPLKIANKIYSKRKELDEHLHKDSMEVAINE
ncbi:hypothetical protein [Sulfurimonas microaerophilic]|uniref:hypothetical protein n=1 Tax=Sulfurimonas microaerophilic TaxID=3058392 RepID=UPI002714B81E|nr:hypothetical protein [Sulfurimonas sp. hsl 1-7]